MTSVPRTAVLDLRRRPAGPTRIRRAGLLGVSCLGVLLVISAMASTNVALPQIGDHLHASQTELQWVVDAYTVTLAALLLFAGAVMDRCGRRRMFVVGLLVFAVASMVSGEAGSAGLLIAARAGMGLGAALIFPVTLSLITTSFPPAERSRAVAIWAIAAASGSVIGLILAGALLEQWWWGSLFVVNAILCAVCLLGVWLFVDPLPGDRATRLDPGGALLAVVAVGATVFGIIEGPVAAWTDPVTIGSIALGCVAGAGFVVYELRRPQPMLDPRVFTLRSVSAGSILNMVQFFAAFGFFLIQAEYFQYVRDDSPLVSGLALAPIGITVVGFAALAQRFGPRLGLRTLGLAGLSAMAGSCLAAATCTAHSPYLHQPLLAVGLLGAGIGLASPLATTAITDGLPLEKQGVASAVNDTSREVGAALGIAITGSVLNSLYRSRLTADPTFRSLPPPAAHAARSSISVAHRLGNGGHGLGAVAEVANQAYMHGQDGAMLATAIVLGLAAIPFAILARRPKTDLPADRSCVHSDAAAAVG